LTIDFELKMTKPNRQTVSYLSRRFEEVGLNPNKRHGQNFLIDLNLIQLLARTAAVGPNDVVLEIGTGMGSLTSLLAEQAAAVVTVEIDQFLHQMAREELERFDNVEMLKQDALKNKNLIHPNVMEAVKRHLAAGENRIFKLAANLPYNVATPIISNLIREDLHPATLTVTIQKELADRLMASPGTKDYGSLSVGVQSLCDVELIRVMSPQVFWPRPKVDSAIVHLIHREKRRAMIPDLGYFHNFVRAMFFHRRKFMRSVAVSAFKEHLDKSQVDAVLQSQGYGADTRTEQLSIAQLQSLCEAFRAVAPQFILG
jgi:16S rRNA (adenine1518-N6/adenine1519-N6)-dimethyltransferase